MNRNIFLCLVLFIISFGCSGNTDGSKSTKQENTFESYIPLIKSKLNLSEVSLLGELRTVNNDTIFILRGETEQDYYSEIKIYLFCTDSSVFQKYLANEKFDMPGNLYDYEEKLIYTSEVFYGELPISKEPAVIWFQKEYATEKGIIESIFVIKISDEKVTYKTITREDSIGYYMNIIDDYKFNEIRGEDLYSDP